MKGLAASLSARTTVVLLAGMLVSNLIGLLIFSGERSFALSRAAGDITAARIAAIVRTVEALPLSERAAALCSQSGPGLGLALSQRPLATGNDSSARAQRMLAALAALPDLKQGHRFVVGAFDPANNAFSAALTACAGGGAAFTFMGPMMGDDAGAGPPPEMRARMARSMRGFLFRGNLVVSLALGDGRWLNILTPAPNFAPFWNSRFLLAFVVMTVLVSILSVWATRRTTQPLALFANAAERLGRETNAPDLPENGPREVARAAHAFNRMKHRLRHLIHARTQMLAAISHDLRTPITRLRLRAEFVESPAQRDKMLADLAQMEAMITATLAFARLDSSDEQPRPLDLAGLVAVACDEAAELGRDVTYEGPDKAEVTARPLALRRVFDNLIDNAVKYGTRARVRLETTASEHVVTIDDDGPGIPDSEIPHVFEPFHRVERSRNPETGGVGLGLAVVRALIEGHGGWITLQNRPEGGLRATVALPRGTPEPPG